MASKRFSIRHIWLFSKAYAFALIEAVLFSVCPYRCHARRLGQCVDIRTAQRYAKDHVLTDQQKKLAMEVEWAIRAVLYRAPFKVWCVPQSLVAQRLFAGRVPWIVYIGYEPNIAVKSYPAKHAWLCCGSIGITGHKEAIAFIPMAAYISNEPYITSSQR